MMGCVLWLLDFSLPVAHFIYYMLYYVLEASESVIYPSMTFEVPPLSSHKLAFSLLSTSEGCVMDCKNWGILNVQLELQIIDN